MKNNIPYCILTNAAGSTELQRANRFNKYLGLSAFSEKNTVQACTPMKEIIRERSERVERDSSYVFVTGYDDVHKLFDHKQKENDVKVPYMTLNEMRAIYPMLFPILSKTN